MATCPLTLSPGGYLWRAPAKPVVTAAAVRARVLRLIPAAPVHLAPHPRTLVNVQTVMWVASPANPPLPAVQILGQRVVITLSAPQVSYDFGDGTTDASGPLGTAYDEKNHPCSTRLCPGYFGHVYTERGMVTVRATVHWTVSFTVDGGRSQAVPGAVAGPSSSVTLHVAEARAVLVPNP